jgi:acetyl-CoA carboxylase biotin carboxylase subunit
MIYPGKSAGTRPIRDCGGELSRECPSTGVIVARLGKKSTAPKVMRPQLESHHGPTSCASPNYNTQMLRRVLIANRGEIVCRVIRACREYGAVPVAVFSDADADALHVKLADLAVWVGNPEPAASYLNQTIIIDAALAAGCDAVHPGYGFLAENAGFAQRVIDAGLAWIGPPPSAMTAMGLKVQARRLAAEAGAAVVPGYDSDQNTAALLRAGREIGIPLLVKASAGGGGRGMRLVRDIEELPDALAAARRESEAAFGNGAVYLERYMERPRHIEVQVLADTHGNVIHLGERECSIQRRHQKLIEETPSTVVDSELRDKLGRDAVEIARRVGYVGAGTIEFIMDASGACYFMEMNTRLQVEHPITELVYGIDLVQWQLRIAAGERLPEHLLNAAPVPRGHAIECRITAEDAAAGFLPQVGTVGLLREPQGPGIRVDSSLYEGLEVGSHYDSLLSKLIVWAEDRPAAIRRLSQALGDYRIHGVVTNIDILRDVVASEPFVAGDTNTSFLQQHFADWQPEPPVPAELIAAALALAAPSARVSTAGGQSAQSAWLQLGTWSNA